MLPNFFKHSFFKKFFYKALLCSSFKVQLICSLSPRLLLFPKKFGLLTYTWTQSLPDVPLKGTWSKSKCSVTKEGFWDVVDKLPLTATFKDLERDEHHHNLPIFDECLQCFLIVYMRSVIHEKPYFHQLIVTTSILIQNTESYLHFIKQA